MAGSEEERLLAFDLGGTTAKLCVVERGEPEVVFGFEAAREARFTEGSGLPIRISTVDLIEIGAGGGSIARRDAIGLLKVGPDSAGSEPGPACYGRGGLQPTVTDANLLLGYLDPARFAGGRLALDREAAAGAVAELAGALGIAPQDAAWGIHDVATEAMAGAARTHLAERGRDASDFALVGTGEAARCTVTTWRGSSASGAWSCRPRRAWPPRSACWRHRRAWTGWRRSGGGCRSCRPWRWRRPSQGWRRRPAPCSRRAVGTTRRSR